jgi:hypothetical protein
VEGGDWIDFEFQNKPLTVKEMETYLPYLQLDYMGEHGSHLDYLVKEYPQFAEH